MKKIISAILGLTLVIAVFSGMALAVSADGSAHMRISASADTVYLGDSFTLTVSLSNDQPVSNGGVIVHYDSNVFEFLGGSCHVSNAVLSEVSAARGGGVFVLQTDAVVSGTVFTINMRVKDSAPFGSYSISGTPSLNIPCSLSGTGITVACRHSYGNSAKVDAHNHASTCTVCGHTLTQAHTWNSGSVTKEATCKDTGIRRLTCTECAATKDETIPVTNQHVYKNWSKVNNSTHSSTCSICGRKETAQHTWNNGTLTQKATCQTTGSRQLTCTACRATRTETVPKTDHPYGACTDLDEAGHKRVCGDCGKETVDAHQYGTDFEHDETWHFHVCQGCGNQAEQAAHTPGPPATETTDQICTVCSRILKPKGAHVHSFSQDWSTDETGHWHACGECMEKDSAAPHEFDDDCDADCNTCGMLREPSHVPAAQWSSDAQGHWYSCESCGEKLDHAPHTPGEEATITSAQLCTVCAFEIAPVLAHDHVFDGQGTLHSHRCACGEVYEAEAADCGVCAAFPWWIVCIIEAVVFGGILAGGFVWMKKKKAP